MLLTLFGSRFLLLGYVVEGVYPYQISVVYQPKRDGKLGCPEQGIRV